jgi:voltage-dependent anion channel protein 2
MFVGLTVTESWNHSNTIGLEVELADSLVKGLKLNFNGALTPASAGGNKGVKLSGEYKQEHVYATALLDVFKGPSVTSDLVVGAEGAAVGGEVSYNVKDGKVTKYGLAATYSTSEYAVSVQGLSNLTAVGVGYFHRVKEGVDAGAKAVYDGKSTVNIEVGSKYTVDATTALKAKFNNGGLLGLSLVQQVRDGVKVTLGGVFDTIRFGEGGHKLGLALNLEA